MYFIVFYLYCFSVIDTNVCTLKQIKKTRQVIARRYGNYSKKENSLTYR